MILETGALLNNRYRIVEILGQGGMGSVYRAIDENLDIQVAVKDNLFTTEEYARQFRREATILATLRHSSLPRVTDHFIVRGQGQYLVMDYIEGEDLRQRMERLGAIPEAEVIIIGAAICDALMYLGTRDPAVIHRDIKPGNVKITPQGQIYLVDFGLAKTLQGSQATTTGARAMTPGFSPPEQYGTARTDVRTDIFSLGATLYAALTGYTPEDALARAMGQAELTPVRKYSPRISRRLSSAIEKSLELQPDDRFQTPDEFKQALLNTNTAIRRQFGEYYVTPPPIQPSMTATEGQGILSGDEQVAVSKPPSDRKNGRSLEERQEESAQSAAEAPKWNSKPIRQRRRRVKRLAWLVFVLGLIAVGAVLWRYDPGIASRTLAQYGPIFSAYLPLPSPSDTAAIDVGTPTPTKSIVTINPKETDSGNPTETQTEVPVVVQKIPSATPTQTAVPPTPLPTPIGGGMGEIAYVSESTGTAQIYLINSDGTGQRQITNLREGACQPDFSPDGQRIIFVSPCESNTDYYPGSSMYIMNIDGTGFLPLPTMVGGDYDPDWGPDGKLIVFTSLRDSSRPNIHILNLEDNTVEVLSEKFAVDSQPAWSIDGKRILFVSERYGRQDIWIMDADGKNQVQFTNAAYLDYNPTWSIDQTNVIFTQYIAPGSVPRGVISPLESESHVEYQIGKEKIPMRDPVMSPDGYWIAFEGWEMGGKHNIFIISTTGINVQQVTQDSVMSFDPVWRPLVK